MVVDSSPDIGQRWRLSTLAPHISLTNKDVAADALTTDYTRAEQKNLLQNRVMVLRKQFGIRALKGISTDTGAFKQISVRRIVDFAKAGVRQGSNPYIGKLNNARVRAALKATLDPNQIMNPGKLLKLESAA